MVDLLRADGRSPIMSSEPLRERLQEAEGDLAAAAHLAPSDQLNPASPPPPPVWSLLHSERLSVAAPL